MADIDKNFDDDSQFRIDERLGADLKGLFEGGSSVPPEIDRAIMDKARRSLVRRKRPYRVVRWAASVASVAAAAVIVFVLSVDRAEKYDARSPAVFVEAVVAPSKVVPSDIDGNGRVDILDAFKLARGIEGVERGATEWDINGDGVVNREDVDYVAFKAVRLDKGV